MDNKEKAVNYVKITLRDYNEGSREKGNTIQTMVDYADYGIKYEVENIFAFLMPVPNTGTIYISQQASPLGGGEQLRLHMNNDEINKKLDEY